MVPSRRHGVNKKRSARKFKSNIKRTKYANINGGLARGGWRL